MRCTALGLLCPRLCHQPIFGTALAQSVHLRAVSGNRFAPVRLLDSCVGCTLQVIAVSGHRRARHGIEVLNRKPGKVADGLRAFPINLRSCAGGLIVGDALRFFFAVGDFMPDRLKGAVGQHHNFSRAGAARVAVNPLIERAFDRPFGKISQSFAKLVQNVSAFCWCPIRHISKIDHNVRTLQDQRVN